jgi:Domain of unknown function (DUF4219)
MSSGTNMVQFPAPMLIGNNYGIWKVKMKTLLLSQGLWDGSGGGSKHFEPKNWFKAL